MSTLTKPEPPLAAPRHEKSAPPIDLPGSAAPAAAAKTVSPWLPAIVALVIAPAATWAVVNFLLVPRLQARLASPVPAGAEVRPETTRDGRPKPTANYEFTNVVVNLAGTMGTRYLKTSFQVIGEPGSADDIRSVFEENRSKLYDTTLNVLSSLTLADLEEAGAKNIIREKLVSAYNQALGKRVADQVYFSEFVVQ